jgi:hypothetical protein
MFPSASGVIIFPYTAASTINLEFLFLPFSRIINRLIPIVELHIDTFRYRNATATNCAPSPQTNELQILLEAQEKRQRYGDYVVNEEIAPTANILLAQAA